MTAAGNEPINSHVKRQSVRVLGAPWLTRVEITDIMRFIDLEHRSIDLDAIIGLHVIGPQHEQPTMTIRLLVALVSLFPFV